MGMHLSLSRSNSCELQVFVYLHVAYNEIFYFLGRSISLFSYSVLVLLQNNWKVFFYNNNNNNGNTLIHQAAHKYPGHNGHIA